MNSTIVLYNTWTGEGAQRCYICTSLYDSIHRDVITVAGWPGECTAGIPTLNLAADAGLQAFLSRSSDMQGEQPDIGVQ